MEFSYSFLDDDSPLRIWRVCRSTGACVVLLQVEALIPQNLFSCKSSIVTIRVAAALSSVDLLVQFVKRNRKLRSNLQIGI